MKYLPFLFLIFFAFSCKNDSATEENASEPAKDERLDFTIELGKRVGLITMKNCQPEDILETYGDLAVADSVYIAEGFWGPGVILFPDDPRNMVEIFWDEMLSKKYPAFIRIQGDSTGTDWKTTEGLTVGMGIAEVEKMNGKPFTLFGFGWDYGGYVTDYANGNFGTSLGMRFNPSVEMYSEKIMGDINVISNDPELLKASPTVERIELRILAKEELPECIAEKVDNYEGRGRMNVRTAHIDGIYHYWLNDGASTYDGTEVILDSACKELCVIGGMREVPECGKIYQGINWDLVWEE